MADYCVFCDTRRPDGGTRKLTLNEGKMRLEFCEKCADSHWLVNMLTGEHYTVGNLYRIAHKLPEQEPTVSYETWLYRQNKLVFNADAPPADKHPTLADVWPSS